MRDIVILLIGMATDRVAAGVSERILHWYALRQLARLRPTEPGPVQAFQEHVAREEDRERKRRLLAMTARQRTPIYRLGERVSHRGECGRVDAVYIDLQAAQDHFLVPRDWLDRQEVKPTSSPESPWYSVVLESGGAALYGEDDLVGPFPMAVESNEDIQ